MNERDEDPLMMLQVVKKRRGVLYLCLIVSMANVSLLIACSQTIAAPPIQNTPNVDKAVVVQSKADKALRAIVKFRQIVAYQDPAFVQSLSQQTQARVSYVSSISEDTHIYLIELIGMHDTAGALRRLGGSPSVLWVELDIKASSF